MPDRIAVIDFETTGMSPAQGARPTEIGVAMIEGGRIVARYQSLMNAGAWVPPFIEQLTGILRVDVAQAQRDDADLLAWCAHPLDEGQLL